MLTTRSLFDFPNPANEAFGWHFQFLTIIGLALATLSFCCGLTADLTGSRRMFFIKNVLLFCSAPLEVLISILYWGLRSVRDLQLLHHLLRLRCLMLLQIDKKLVLPEWGQLDIRADISFHAVPGILLAIDLLFFSPPWTIGTLPAMALSLILACSYWVWVEVCYARNGW